MNKTSLLFMSAAVLCCTSALADSSSHNGVSPTFVIRSQSSDNARKVVGEVAFTHLDRECKYWALAITPGYSESFRSGRIAHTLFGNSLVSTVTSSNGCCDNDCGDTILIQGSTYNNGNRDPHAWLADYFYLAPDYNGSFSVRPQISNFFVDFDLYTGLDEWYCGGYFRIYAPFVHTRWNLRFCEQVPFTTQGYDQGYFSSARNTNATIAVPNNQLVTSFGAYANGSTPTILNSDNSLVKTDPLNYAKISPCSRTKNGLADLRAELGWNFWQSDCYHLGINLQLAAPTGSRRHAEYLFDPVVGNGHHWEFGGGVTGHWLFWENDNNTRHLGIYLDTNITHLFKAHEQRTFDLIGKPNSRYMLAAKMNPSTSNLGLNGGGIRASSTFANEFSPVANLTTFDLKVSAGVQADLALWLNYTSCGWSWDLGYNFFGRSKEKFQLRDCNNQCNTNICNESQRNTWVLKGDARVYGFRGNAAVALSASESKATICSGTNKTAASCITTGDVDALYNNNCGVDNQQLAFTNATGANLSLSFNTSTENQIATSIQPVFIKCEDVDFAATRIISNKIFTHLSYAWECECYTPFLGIGGSAEFGNNSKCSEDFCSTSSVGCTSPITTDSNCDDLCNTSNRSVNTSLSQWSVWLKAGLAFN